LANDYSTVYNARAPIAFSSASGTWAGTGTTFPALDRWDASVLPATGVVMDNFPTPYSSASLAYATAIGFQGVGTKYRIVAAGLRIRYTGAEITRSGVVHMFHSPDHSSVSTVALTDISNIPSYFNRQMDRKWHTLTYAPVQPNEVAFLLDGIVNPITADGFMGSQNSDMLNHYLGIMVSGAAASAPFDVESIIHWEVIGETISGKTQSDVDLNGLSIVSNVANPSHAPILDSSPGLLERIASTVPQSVTDLAGGLLTASTPALQEVGKSLLNRMTRATLSYI